MSPKSSKPYHRHTKNIRKLGILMKINWPLLLMILLFPFVTGCSSVYVRSADVMYKSNPIKKIALISEARVEWPRIMHKDAQLGIKESQRALKEIMPNFLIFFVCL
mgnify:CR=1 FL=1